MHFNGSYTFQWQVYVSAAGTHLNSGYVHVSTASMHLFQQRVCISMVGTHFYGGYTPLSMMGTHFAPLSMVGMHFDGEYTCQWWVGASFNDQYAFQQHCFRNEAMVWDCTNCSGESVGLKCMSADNLMASF